jgi:hypothetical protein
MGDGQILREIAKRHETFKEATLRYYVQDITNVGRVGELVTIGF